MRTAAATTQLIHITNWTYLHNYFHFFLCDRHVYYDVLPLRSMHISVALRRLHTSARSAQSKDCIPFGFRFKSVSGQKQWQNNNNNESIENGVKMIYFYSCVVSSFVEPPFANKSLNTFYLHLQFILLSTVVWMPFLFDFFRCLFLFGCVRVCCDRGLKIEFIYSRIARSQVESTVRYTHTASPAMTTATVTIATHRFVNFEKLNIISIHEYVYIRIDWFSFSFFKKNK